MKKKCELCKSRGARMYCDSDQASLCWECDERVHSANFLVAKHSRNLLCHVCQSLTQWKASGSKFGPTFSVCQICFLHNNHHNINHNEGGGGGSRSSVRRERDHNHDDDEDQEAETTADDDDDDDEYSDDSEEDEEEDDEIEEEEDGENQVVPWTTPPPPSVSTSPPVATTSSSEIGSFYNNNNNNTRDGGGGVDSDLKRFRENTLTPDSEDEDGCCSSQVNVAARISNSTRIIGRSVGLSQQRWDSEGKRVRRMDATSSFMRFQER